MMKQILHIETILYVEDKQRSTVFYRKLFRQDPIVDVPGITEFRLAPNVKIGLMPNNGIARLLQNKTTHPSKGNGIPRCELYFQVQNLELEFDNALKSGARLISPVEPRLGRCSLLLR